MGEAAVASPEPAVMRRRDFAWLTACYCLSSIQFWMTIPLAAIALAEQGLSAWEIGLIGAIPWLALVLLVPFAPRLSARYGATAVFRFGTGVSLAGAICFAADQAIWLWAIGYALCGGGIALRWVVADGLIVALAPAHLRGARVGLFETLVGATMALGPLIPAMIGTSGSLPYLIGVSLVAASVVLLPLVDLREPPPAVPQRTARLVDVLAVARTYPIALLAAITAGIIEGAATKLFPVQAIGMGLGQHLAAGAVVALGAGNILTQYAAGRLADRFGTGATLGWALVILAAAALAVPLATGVTTAYLAVLVVVGGVVGSLYTLAVIEAGRTGSALAAMTAIAAVGLGYTLGSVMGPVLGGTATSLSLPWGLPLTIAAAATLALFILKVVIGRNRRSTLPTA
jgi:MFS family permease